MRYVCKKYMCGFESTDLYETKNHSDTKGHKEFNVFVQSSKMFDAVFV